MTQFTDLLDEYLAAKAKQKHYAENPRLGPIATDYLEACRKRLNDLMPHRFTGNGPGCVGADNCQICGRWFNEPETIQCRNTT